VPGFPDSLKTLVEHLIISHHGQYDFGSPKLPMFTEALLLHYLDDLDSKMESMRAQFERGAESDGAWTAYNPSLGRPLLNTAKFLAEKASGDEEEETDPNLVSVPETPTRAEGDGPEGFVTPTLTGLESPEKAEEKEKTGPSMTSAVHEDKI